MRVGLARLAVAGMALVGSTAWSASPEVLPLAQALELALKQNRALQAARLDRLAQRFELRVAQDAFTPKFTLSPELLRSQNPGATAAPVRTDAATLAAAVNQATPTGAQVTLSAQQTRRQTPGTDTQVGRSWTINLTQPLLKGAGVEVATAPRRLAELNEQTNVWAFKSVVTDTVFSVVSAYRQYVRSLRSLDIARQSVERARELLEINRTLIQTGRMAEIDLVQSEADLANQSFNLLAAENDVDASRLALAELLGLSPQARFLPDDRLPIQPVRYDLDQALALAQQNRPDWLSAELAVTVAEIRLMLAKNQTQPDLALVAQYSSQTPGAGAGTVQPWLVGLRMTMPLNDLALQKAVVQAEVDQDKATLRLQELRNRLETEVRSALRNLEMNNRQQELAQLALQLAQRKFDAETEKFKAGRSSNFQLLSYKNDLVNAQNNALNTTMAYLDGLTAFERTLGVLLDTWQVELISP